MTYQIFVDDDDDDIRVILNSFFIWFKICIEEYCVQLEHACLKCHKNCKFKIR